MVHETIPRGLLLLGCSVVAATGLVAAELPEAVVECLACHEDPDLTLALTNGSRISLHVTGDDFASSVHGREMVCTDCHSSYDTDHPWGREFSDSRAYTIASYELCKSCHFESYTHSLESVHVDLLEHGVAEAPVCADCHGAHDVRAAVGESGVLSRACGRCHGGVMETYRASVHGQGLVGDGNADMPGCPTCHRSHLIETPQSAAFRMRSPEICLGCHADPVRMERYGLTADVGPTYLSDFHGVTAAFTRRDEDPRQLTVTCVDCHGFHAIASSRTVGTKAMDAHVAATCARCHEGAAPDFPDAWLSHYPPSPRHAPMVWLVDLAYKIFIPFVVFGLGVQVALHLYRVAVRK